MKRPALSIVAVTLAAALPVFAADLDITLDAYALLEVSAQDCGANWHPRTEEFLINRFASETGSGVTTDAIERMGRLASARVVEFRNALDTSQGSDFCRRGRSVAQQSWTTVPKALGEQ